MTNLKKKIGLSISAFTCLMISSSSFSKALTKSTLRVSYRADLVPKLQSTLCKSKLSISPKSAWENGVFDAQIEGRFYSPRKNRVTSPDDMKKRAISLAKRMHHHGAASGICPDGTGWTASVPSPWPIILNKKGRLNLPLKSLAAHCKDYSIDFSSNEGGFSRRIKKSKSPLRVAKLGTGSISVTCLPRHPSWQGPVTWYLRPIGHLDQMNAPLNYIFKENKRLDSSLALWVNEIRKKEGLTPLVFGYEVLNRSAGILAIGGSIIHNRKMLPSAKKSLKQGRVDFVGENRVKARSRETMAALLWSSPKHRDLLLSKRATHLGIYLQKQHDGIFAVFLLGSGPRLNISLKKSKEERG